MIDCSEPRYARKALVGFLAASVILCTESPANVDLLYGQVRDSLNACSKALSDSSPNETRRLRVDSLVSAFSLYPGCSESIVLSYLLTDMRKDGGSEKTAREVRGMIATTQDIFARIHPVTCFRDSASVLEGECGELMRRYFDVFGIRILDGVAFRNYLDQDFSEAIDRHDWNWIRSDDRVSRRFLERWLQVAAETVRNFDDGCIALDAGQYHFRQPTHPARLDDASEVCLDDRFLTIKKRMPIYESRVDRLQYSLLNLDVLNTTFNCSEASQRICENVFFAKGVAILSYVTTDCKVRDVTAGDVSSDLRAWEENGIEEAARLQHSELSDLIQYCQGANDAGYWWDYHRPTLPKSCKRARKPAPKVR